MPDRTKEIAFDAIEVLEREGLLRQAAASTYREQIRAADSEEEIEEIILRVYTGPGVDDQQGLGGSLTPVGNPKRN